MIEYVPKVYSVPPKLMEIQTAWGGLESILEDITTRFCPNRGTALEFGVEYAYSTIALSNFFDMVIGVDHFMGDGHAGLVPSDFDLYKETKEKVKKYGNISIVRDSWQHWSKFVNSCENEIYHKLQYDLIHIDIYHTFEETYACGSWSVRHSPCVLFHDTESWPEVKPAVAKIAEENNKIFYNFPKYNGLGILVDHE